MKCFFQWPDRPGGMFKREATSDTEAMKQLQDAYLDQMKRGNEHLSDEK